MNWLSTLKKNNKEQKLNNKIQKINKTITNNDNYYKSLFDTYLLDELFNDIIFLKEDLDKNFPYILHKANTSDILDFMLKHIDYTTTMYNNINDNENLSDSDNEDFFEI